MSEPIPDVRAAAALPDLVTLLHTDPIARPLLGDSIYTPYFTLTDGGLSIHYHDDRSGLEQLAAAQALFDGGEVSIEPGYSARNEQHTLSTTWQGVPLKVVVKVEREDELATLRKRVAELEAVPAGQGVAE